MDRHPGDPIEPSQGVAMRTIDGISNAVTNPSTEDEQLVFDCESFIRQVILVRETPTTTRKRSTKEGWPYLELTFCMTSREEPALAFFTCNLTSNDIITATFSFPLRRTEVVFDAYRHSYGDDDRRSVFSHLLGEKMKMALLSAYALHS